MVIHRRNHAFQSTPGNYAGRILCENLLCKLVAGVSIHSRQLCRENPASAASRISIVKCFNPLPAIMPGESRLAAGLLDNSRHVSIHSRQLCRENRCNPALKTAVSSVSIHSRQLCRENRFSHAATYLGLPVSIHSRQLCRENHIAQRLSSAFVKFQSTPGNYAGRIFFRVHGGVHREVSIHSRQLCRENLCQA